MLTKPKPFSNQIESAKLKYRIKSYRRIGFLGFREYIILALISILRLKPELFGLYFNLRP